MAGAHKPRGAGHRPERVAERIHQEISLMFSREVSDPRLAGANVTRVDVSSDLRYAKVFLTPRATAEESDEMMEALARAAGYFRRHLAQSLDLRYAPEIRFQLDRGIEKGEHFLQVLEEVQAETRESTESHSPKRGKGSHR